MGRREVKNLARPGVNQRQVSSLCSRSDARKISAFGIKLPKQAVQVFICALLPGTVGVGKIDFAMQSFFNVVPVGKLCTSVASNGLTEEETRIVHRQ